MITAKEAVRLSLASPEQIKLNFQGLKSWLNNEIRRCATQGNYSFDISIFSNKKDILKLRKLLISNGFEFNGCDEGYFEFSW